MNYLQLHFIYKDIYYNGNLQKLLTTMVYRKKYMANGQGASGIIYNILIRNWTPPPPPPPPQKYYDRIHFISSTTNVVWKKKFQPFREKDS